PLDQGGQYLLYRADAFRSEKEKNSEWLHGKPQPPPKHRAGFLAGRETGLDRELERFHLARPDALFDNLVVGLAGEHHAPVEDGREPDVVLVERLGVEHNG